MAGPRRSPDHLPNLRPGSQPPHPSWLPRQRRGTTPQMIGRYPDFDVLDAVDTWDEATRKVVLARLDPPGPLRLLHRRRRSRRCARSATSCWPRTREPRVPVAEMVDAKLADGKLDGYRYADMPDDRDTWRPGAARPGRDRPASGTAGRVRRLPTPSARRIVGRPVRRGRLRRRPRGTQLNVSRAWSVCMRDDRWPRSTPTRGRGTRSASAARPTRGASCGWAGRPGRQPCASRSRRRGATERGPGASWCGRRER